MQNNRITAVELLNYRSIKSELIKFDPRLTVLIGPNGGGKTNILKAIELLSASAQGNLSKQLRSTGGIDQNLYFQQRPGLLELTVFHETSDKNNALFPLNDIAGYQGCFGYLLALSQFGNAQNYEIRERLGTVGGKPLLQQYRDEFLLLYGENEINTSVAPRGSPEETLLSKIGILSSSYDAQIIYAQGLASWKFFQSFDTTANSPIRRDVITRYDAQLEPDGQNLVEVLHTLCTSSKEFKEDLFNAMDVAFEGEFEELIFAPSADQRIQMKVRWKNSPKPISAALLSDGTLQFLRLIAILANPQPPDLVAIDEPELGLNPRMMRVIAALADRFCETSQLIYATHSIAMLDAIQCLNPLIAVVECKSQENQPPRTIVSNPSADRLEHWIENYTLGELFKMQELERMSDDVTEPAQS